MLTTEQLYESVGNNIHSELIYYMSTQEQKDALFILEHMLRTKDFFQLKSLMKIHELKEPIQTLLENSDIKDWNKNLETFCSGLIVLLQREISKSEKVPIMGQIELFVQKELKKLDIFNENDIIKVSEIRRDVFEVKYINRNLSPEHDGKFTLWRDTEMHFILNFSKGLFIWQYINIHSSTRGQGLGSKLVSFVEQLAKDLGFKRFTVEWPNKGFWNKFNYDVLDKYAIGTGKHAYWPEGYKEIEK